ncbi:hypothetical protein [uncultured Psychrobacter sp.]|uniref:hypothetical protein n=1 Tax=uncultured Psychrobacter sp. TaxID=259303 RepID=UPI00263A1E21|nr:hypothetical protein [uncultured Psychrobacter sp.]
MRLLFAASTMSNTYPAGYLWTYLGAVVLTFSALIFSTTIQASSGYTSDYATRELVANPDNFKRIRINGRGVSEAVAPCPVAKGIIDCTLAKLSLINLPVRSVHEDYDLAQVFYYPNTEQPTTAVVIMQKTGLMDDSLSGHRYRVSFKLEEDDKSNTTWNFVQYGEQLQCARGDMAGKWQKGDCV